MALCISLSFSIFSLTVSVDPDGVLRIFEGDVQRHKATLNITSDMNFEFTVERGFKIQSTVPAVHAIEIGLWFFLGYVYRLLSKRSKTKDEPKSEFEGLLVWTSESVS